MDIAIVGQNLLHDTHTEFDPTGLDFVPTRVQRSAYAKVTWRF